MLTPDFDLEVVDLNTQGYRLLARHANFPRGLANQIYAFDPISDEELRTLNMEARALALVLAPGGAGSAPAGDSCCMAGRRHGAGGVRR